jgi:uncharacterized protein YneR
MNNFTKFSKLVFGISLFLFFTNDSIAQLRPLYSNGRMVESNVPVLDSAEKASMPKMVLLEDALSIENPSQLKYKKKVDIRLFQIVNALKFNLYVDNKYKQKVTIKVIDGSGITIFEDVPTEQEKFQRLYDMTFLTDKDVYYFTAFYDNQDHYFFPIRLESKVTIDEVAKLSTEYPIEKGKN